MYCIYRITNKINGKTYIGQHKYKDDSNPMKRYRGSGKLLLRAYKKYGIENFSIEVLYKRIQYKKTIDSMEIWMIEKERKTNPNGCYNITDGGSGGLGTTVSDYQRQRIIESNKIYKTGKKAWNSGKKGLYHISEETKYRMSEAHKGKSSPAKGKHWKLSKPRKTFTEEHRRKLSQALKKRIITDETRRKLSLARKGKIGWNKGRHLVMIDGRRHYVRGDDNECYC